MNNPKFNIGTQYKTRRKYPRICTVIDILKTYNSKNELVQIRYVSTHEFSGQLVTDRDVTETTIAMGYIKPPCACGDPIDHVFTQNCIPF